MLQTIKEFFQLAPFAAWTILATLVILIFVSYAWEKVKWWWLNTWVSFPFIGVIARTSKEDTIVGDSWYKSEESLCDRYLTHVQIMDEHDYDEMNSYLVYAGDNGRTPMPGLLWPLIVLMVFIEAMGFSYVLAGFTIPGGSENIQQYGAVGIAILVSALLIPITHFTGHELYLNTILKRTRRDWQEEKRNAKEGGGDFPLRTQTVSLNMPQSTDSGEKEYTRIKNRLKRNYETYKVSIFAAIFIAGVAIGATYVRGQVLERMLSDDRVGRSEQVHIKNDALDMSADIKLPFADKFQDQSAKDEAYEKNQSTERHGGWGTFIVLALIFLALQILSIFFGINWGFAGQNSEKAYKALGSGKYANYSQVLNYYDYICNVAQSKLQDLQQRMIQRNSETGSQFMAASKKTFEDYLAKKREIRLRDNKNRVNNSRNEVKIQTQASQEKAADPILTKFDAKEIAQKLNSFTDKNDKLKFLEEAKLTEAQQEQVALILDGMKNKINTKLDGLL